MASTTRRSSPDASTSSATPRPRSAIHPASPLTAAMTAAPTPPRRRSRPRERRRGGVGAAVMAAVKGLAGWMAERGLGVAELVEASGLERRVVEAIAQARYTPSPQQRQRLAAALGVAPEEVAWGH